MATIQENLDLLQSTKSAIKNAIIEKGVSVSDSDSFASYADKIGEIETGGTIQKAVVGSDVLVFNNNITTINDSYDFSNITTSTQFGNSSATTIGGGSTYESGNIVCYTGFKNCTSLTNFTSNLTNLTTGTVMFARCSQLINFSSDLSSLTNGTNMFLYCIGLTNWNIDLPNLNNGLSMFQGCSNLQTFISNLSNLTETPLYSDNTMFSGCTALENFTLSGTLNCDNFNLSVSTNLTVDSLVNVISVLADLTGQSSKTLILGSTNLAKLTDEQKAVATNKNWILS
jgi:hypothetical protein